jgi:hypothetical protein
MIRRSRVSTPPGWPHPRLSLHRAWHSRRVWQHRARGVLIATAVLIVVVWIFQLSPFVLVFALLGAFIPAPPPTQSLLELEQAHGEAYTTALTAPEDKHGFKDRLEGMAAAVQKNANLPSWPWLELMGMAALLSLLLVLPRAVSALPSDGSSAVPPTPRNASDNLPSTPQNPEAAPVLDAPSQDAPAGEATAKPGAAASSGAASEQQLGRVKPGEGEAGDDPQAISKEFLDALERNATRDRDGAQNQKPQVDNASPSSDAEDGGSGQRDDQANQNQDRQDGSSQGKDGAQRNSGKNRQNAQQNGQQSGDQNGQAQQDDQTGQQQGSSGNAGQQGDQKTAGNGQQNAQKPSGQTANKNTQNRADRNNLDSGDEQSGDSGSSNNGSPSNRTTPGQGGKGGSQVIAVNRPKTSGKLEYVPGTVRGNNVRSGALQLPGDPKNGFTSTPGSAAYRRSAEAAVLDPRLPPEYQEMLKNYYK